MVLSMHLNSIFILQEEILLFISFQFHNMADKSEATTRTGDEFTNIQQCTPRSNIVFIKTHKTGGSTITNILSIFAMKHNLSIFGHEGCLYASLRYDICIQKKLHMNLSRFGKSNIISEHIMYKRNILSTIMSDDVIYVTQLRHPLSQLISWLHFNGHIGVNDPVDFYDNMIPFKKHISLNSWIQMGIPNNASEQEFKSYLKSLAREFDLISITEQFDLSLLLLRRKLCWEISDMIYIPMKKANFTHSKNSHFSNITKDESIKNKYKILNPNAYILYDHFKTILSRKISQAGQDLEEEYMFFQELRQNVSNFCSKYIEMIAKNSTMYLDVLKTTDVLVIPGSKWGSARTFDPIECAILKLHKRTFQGISTAKSFTSEPRMMTCILNRSIK